MNVSKLEDIRDQVEELFGNRTVCRPNRVFKARFGDSELIFETVRSGPVKQYRRQREERGGSDLVLEDSALHRWQVGRANLDLPRGNGPKTTRANQAYGVDHCGTEHSARGAPPRAAERGDW